MTALDDLYQDILSDPDSDEPRLVYADALQAAGDPRGEFIAVQCELARLGCDRTRLALYGGEIDGDGNLSCIRGGTGSATHS